MMGHVETLQGQLLVAGGGLFDPNFRQAVVLVAEHTDQGAMGVVLNRRTNVTVGEAAPSLATTVGPDQSLFMGGPVQPQTAVVLAEFEHPDFAGRLVFGSIGFPPQDLESEGLPGVTRARIFAGYAGWGAGQLEHELEESSWIVEPASSDDVFTDAPQELWRTVLRRKGGDYAMLALMPFDPSTN
jgi:putative transcriptional regulator